MFKFISIVTKIVITTLIALLFGSCQSHSFMSITGSGNVTTESRPVTESFKAVEAEKGLDIVLEQSDKQSITVIADDNLQNISQQKL